MSRSQLRTKNTKTYLAHRLQPQIQHYYAMTTQSILNQSEMSTQNGYGYYTRCYYVYRRQCSQHHILKSRQLYSMSSDFQHIVSPGIRGNCPNSHI
jgi:hypothetical protein